MFSCIFSLFFDEKNLDLGISILDLEISIPDLEFSISGIEKFILDLAKNSPNFRQFFVKIFAKKSVLKFWQNKSDFPIF
ncbi:MAG: hypothetical protein II304_13035 [Bacteroidales bacterium]|nr:hypothetical protein [Bacteroidales bacterium]